MVHFADVQRVTMTSNEPRDYCKDMHLRFFVTSKKLFTIVQVIFIACSKSKRLAVFAHRVNDQHST
jgi:hypothetical protein